jgi:hypothetical protein
MYLFTLFEPELFDRQLENERTDVAVVNENAVLESWYNYVCVFVCVVHNTVLYSDKKSMKIHL